MMNLFHARILLLCTEDWLEGNKQATYEYAQNKKIN